MAFLGDLRGGYPFGGDCLDFPTKVSDLLTLRFGGGSMFYEVREAHIAMGYKGVALGGRYYGTGDSLFEDVSVYLSARAWNIGISFAYGHYRIGNESWEYRGAVLSLEGRSQGALLRFSLGYLLTPMVMLEGDLRKKEAGLLVLAKARPGYYADIIFNPYIVFESLTVGATYRTSGNAFGVAVTYGYGWGRSAVHVSTHELLGESLWADNLFIIK